ncbi:CubicO group peptidase (beta-lactamase class C family) [Sediminibacterium magnilacihabitans]|jgi:CubicO group peptidase (beta-lactamase class C family)|nr:CubicO group peptidase (beta-lactamase class C family) [Sediminibacterium magnilacihabitans]
MLQSIAMHKRLFLLFKGMVLLCSLCPMLSVAQQKEQYHAPVFEDKDRLQRMEALFPVVAQLYASYAEKNHFPGYAFGIMLDGKLVYKGSGGYIDLENKIPATTTAMFRIASMSKSFTAMAILQLRDQGKLQLDDPVSKYIPEIRNQQLTSDAPVITIRHLLTHAAGFPEDNPWGDRQLADTREALLQLIKKGISFSNVPGVAYEYSNLGFASLGYIIEKVTGKPYSEYIAEHIWKPLNMNQAMYEYSRVPAAQLAHGYRWINGDWKTEALLHDGIYGAMGGMITSIESFSKYVALHQQAWPPRNDAEQGPLKRSSIREMHQPWRFSGLNAQFTYPDGRKCPVVSAYGYGLRWSKDCEGRTIIEHSGGLPGFGSNWKILPEYGLGVILFANLTYASTSAINLQVLDTLIRAAKLKPASLPPSDILKERQAALLKLLPSWDGAASSGIFAENFFADYLIDALKKEAKEMFEKAGTITRVGKVMPENQLRGSFTLYGTNTNILVSFTLTPEHPALIQEYHIRNIAR